MTLIYWSLIVLVSLNGGLQVIVLFTAEGADIVECFETFLGFCQVVGLQVKLTQIFVGAAMFRVNGQCLLIGTQGQVKLLQFSVTEAEVVPGVGIRWFGGNYFIKQF